MSGVLSPLVPLYAIASAAKNHAYEKGWLRQKRLQGPVVSIGNLSVGGSGKTPLTIRLAQLLREAGSRWMCSRAVMDGARMPWSG